jgi:hypothetical protein
MFLRSTPRKKNGKVHKYWSLVEARRLSDGRVVQRHVLYLGEINANQRQAWRRTIEVHDQGMLRQVALFPEDSVPCDDVDAVGVRLSELHCCARANGAPAGWRCSCGAHSNWTASGGRAFAPRAKARPG